jgi:hypothetical protein
MKGQVVSATAGALAKTLSMTASIQNGSTFMTPGAGGSVPA